MNFLPTAMISDPSEQSQSGPAETLIGEFPVDFTPSTPNLIPTFAAMTKRRRAIAE